MEAVRSTQYNHSQGSRRGDVFLWAPVMVRSWDGFWDWLCFNLLTSQVFFGRYRICLPLKRYQVYHSSATNRMIATWHHTSQYAFNSFMGMIKQKLKPSVFSHQSRSIATLATTEPDPCHRDAKVLLEALGTRPVETGGSILSGAARSGPPSGPSQNSARLRVGGKKLIRFSSNSGWWWLEHVVFFPSIGNVIIPTD